MKLKANICQHVLMAPAFKVHLTLQLSMPSFHTPTTVACAEGGSTTVTAGNLSCMKLCCRARLEYALQYILYIKETHTNQSLLSRVPWNYFLCCLFVALLICSDLAVTWFVSSMLKVNPNLYFLRGQKHAWILAQILSEITIFCVPDLGISMRKKD